MMQNRKYKKMERIYYLSVSFLVGLSVPVTGNAIVPLSSRLPETNFPHQTKSTTWADLVRIRDSSTPQGPVTNETDIHNGFLNVGPLDDQNRYSFSTDAQVISVP
jgi:hypothetical protein